LGIRLKNRQKKNAENEIIQDDKLVYKTTEIAEIFGVSRFTVILWIKTKQIYAYKLGRFYFIPRDEVMKLITGVK
jgi:excisionase family DNA binding protein